jgi:hypothetical protein
VSTKLLCALFFKINNNKKKKKKKKHAFFTYRCGG